MSYSAGTWKRIQGSLELHSLVDADCDYLPHNDLCRQAIVDVLCEKPDAEKIFVQQHREREICITRSGQHWLTPGPTLPFSVQECVTDAALILRRNLDVMIEQGA